MTDELLDEGDRLKVYSSLSNTVVYVARKNIGYGEEGVNNSGLFIESMGGKPGHEWCALFARWCIKRAHEIKGLWAPSWLDRMPGVPEVGAKRLTKAVGRVGRFFTDPLEARPGDLVCWHRRTGLISWKGHVGIVEKVDPDGIIHTIEGNVGAFPAKVKRLSHDVRKERLYGFASLTKGK
jgi:hypothetical protein